MPRHATYMLRWVEEEQAYELTGAGAPIIEPQNLKPGNQTWFDWLENVTSFAFASRAGTNYTAARRRCSVAALTGMATDRSRARLLNAILVGPQISLYPTWKRLQFVREASH